ncbi:hypothetical protein LR48_Vigan11g072500 [Vigna angularis]|uniref:Secreted protein n=1 Tax=Phaseolus angularis TaxID=3914 RepID=A0A0L9VS45_PHAAN|nr:hypothetical protein LR48_Vigan11g072500 [Vigna angularis]
MWQTARPRVMPACLFTLYHVAWAVRLLQQSRASIGPAVVPDLPLSPRRRRRHQSPSGPLSAADNTNHSLA